MEARLVETGDGLVPEGDGWFVLNARDAPWWESEEFGRAVAFEGPQRFPELGINVNVLAPGQPLCRYHGEDVQEDFLVLAGEAVALVDGVERPLRAWDLLHCPAWVEHVVVGAGEGPCTILAVGARRRPASIRYPVSELALRHGAGVREETTQPAQAYADCSEPARVRYRDGDLA